MFAAVTVVAAASAWLAHEYRIVQERKAIDAWARTNGAPGAPSCSKPEPVSWVRELLGDRGFKHFFFPAGISQRELDRIKAAFPEAEISSVMTYLPAPAPMPGEPPRENEYGPLSPSGLIGPAAN